MSTTPTTYSPEYLAESRTTVLNAFFSLPIPLEIISTAVRLWAKRKGPGESPLTYDDFLIIWATIIGCGACITGLVAAVPYGLGRHIQAVPEEDVEMFLMGDYIFSHFYDVAIASTKLSILALYYRIFAIRRFRQVVLATAFAVLVWLIVIEVLLGIGCRPIEGWWRAIEATCLDKVAFTYSTNTVNLATDVWVFVMPIPIILRLPTSLSKRLSLLCLFSIGLATCAISAARLSVIVSVGSDDITWNEVPLGILSAWEPCGGILCANLPLVYQVVIRAWRHVRSTVSSSKPQKSSAGSAGRYTNEYREWVRINHSGGVGANSHASVHITRGGDISELDDLAPDGIVVQRGFHQQVHHAGDEIPLREDV
ncbi:hypothetical protein F4778DRAFT_801874 [Xylariomycetidae sp. FL2044]|nr:hypothetical protein F4778DRAFT_801874 [Xylariomycetidae sp. FL2044]